MVCRLTHLAFTLRDFSFQENRLADYPSFLTEEHNKMLNSSFRCTTLAPIEQSSTVFNTNNYVKFKSGAKNGRTKKDKNYCSIKPLKGCH